MEDVIIPLKIQNHRGEPLSGPADFFQEGDDETDWGAFMKALLDAAESAPPDESGVLENRPRPDASRQEVLVGDVPVPPFLIEPLIARMGPVGENRIMGSENWDETLSRFPGNNKPVLRETQPAIPVRWTWMEGSEGPRDQSAAGTVLQRVPLLSSSNGLPAWERTNFGPPDTAAPLEDSLATSGSPVTDVEVPVSDFLEFDSLPERIRQAPFSSGNNPSWRDADALRPGKAAPWNDSLEPAGLSEIPIPEGGDSGSGLSRIEPAPEWSGLASSSSGNQPLWINAPSPSPNPVTPRDPSVEHPLSTLNDAGADPDFLIEQVSGRIISFLRRGGGDSGRPLEHTIRISLHPESLGRMEVKVSVVDDQIRATLVAESARVKELIDSQQQSLRSVLQEHGFKVNDLNVTVGHQMSGGHRQSMFFHGELNDQGRRGTLRGRGETGAPMNPGFLERGIGFYDTRGSVNIFA
jgi:hypothetical protein